MSATWTVVVVVSLATIAIKATGPMLLGGRPLPRRLDAVVGLLAPALLAALVAVNTFGGNRELVLDARVPGVVAAAVAIRLRAPVLLVVIVAAAVTATVRALAGVGSADMTRYRDLGLSVGLLPPGELNAITDVDGVTVGTTTVVEGEGALEVGRGPVRTGVTVVVPHAGIGAEPVFAGCHRLNGNGELTGLEWIRESGQLTTPVAITNTHSVGIVRDALVAAQQRGRADATTFWSLPVVGETYDGALNDIDGQHVRAEHLFAALDGASGGPVPEGGVGGGTGMICHEFKGGTGTASRVGGSFTVGALVQANHGRRERLSVDGVPVGREIPTSAVASPWDEEEAIASRSEPGAGSIIAVLATDAPLLPHQLTRLAQRAGLGIARAGGAGEHSSGDIFLAFSTANRGALPSYKLEDAAEPVGLTMLPDSAISDLFWAAIEATEEAILNALVAAETMVGRDGITAHAIDHDLLVDAMTRYARGPGAR